MEGLTTWKEPQYLHIYTTIYIFFVCQLIRFHGRWKPHNAVRNFHFSLSQSQNLECVPLSSRQMNGTELIWKFHALGILVANFRHRFYGLQVTFASVRICCLLISSKSFLWFDRQPTYSSYNKTHWQKVISWNSWKIKMLKWNPESFAVCCLRSKLMFYSQGWRKW